MQTITIAVSAILVAAGLMTAPGLIVNARENNARTDLANLAFAQEWALTNNSRYVENVKPGEVDSLYELTTGSELSTGIKYNLSGGVAGQSALICNDGQWHYIMRATVANNAGVPTGRTFYIVDGSAAISDDASDLGAAQCILDLPAYGAFVL